ncbi:MAG: 3-oxoacyl-ACP reductase FabG [Xanthomonadales bacterium]|nr:3-oxoacyl-ACP reductase FabG [Xanthomonadales bacterium]
MLNRYRLRVALVTGAGRGIGAAIARRLHAEGASVVLADRDGDAAAALAAELGGERVLALAVDVTARGELEALMARIQSDLGGLDLLVNNAGIIRDGFLAKLSEADWDTVLAVNLKGPFLCCQAALPLLRARSGGAIVNIASRSWLGNPGQSNYSASKGGVVSLTRTLALELARFAIRVNAVAPGLIDTPMTQAMPTEARERLLRMQPTGQMGTPADIAAAVAFLGSADAAFISGQVLHVDGGKSCGLLGL